MKVPTSVIPWWGQATLLVLGMAGAILIEYLQTIRELEYAGSNEDDEQTIESKPHKTRSRRTK